MSNPTVHFGFFRTNKRAFETSLTTLALLLCTFGAQAAPVTTASKKEAVRNNQIWISLSPKEDCLWRYGAAKGGAEHSFTFPEFEIDGKQVVAKALQWVAVDKPMQLANGVTEHTFEGTLAADPHLKLRLQFQVNADTPVIRFRYSLIADKPCTLTAPAGENRLTYFKTSLRPFPEVKEISLSNFVDLTHSYTLDEQEIAARHFENCSNFMGPILAASDGSQSFMVAYEHGSETPFAFLRFQLDPERGIRLAAVKGNYFPGQTIDAGHCYSTVWLETAAVAGSLDQLASTYRRFILKSMAANGASRRPYIYYNTYGHQERNKWWNGNWWAGKPYPTSEENILKEIDVAYRMGVDVFVIDGGSWADKIGDWTTLNSARFPNGLKEIRAKLDGYGMKLGLWFAPTWASELSKTAIAHPEWRISRQGKPVFRLNQAMDQEKIAQMCLMSGYADYFANQLIELAKETGVTYFKWDMIHQYECDDLHHNHGGANNTEQDRADNYAFQLIQAMSYVTDKVAAAVPGTIVDFDVSEPERAMGLGFLASGKYFLINNGPYYRNYDIPNDRKTSNPNVFFFPGQARAWNARSPLTYDKWIPAVLFLVHYFTDDPVQLQEVSAASLILGHNGLWGDLLNVSDTGIAFIGELIAKYKPVRDDINESDPIVTGIVSGSPEIHEKISTTNGRGAVVIFATVRGSYEYVTHHAVADDHWSGENITVSQDKAGHAIIRANFDKPGARIVFFGVK